MTRLLCQPVGAYSSRYVSMQILVGVIIAERLRQGQWPG
jgi:hypothetical protein